MKIEIYSKEIETIIEKILKKQSNKIKKSALMETSTLGLKRLQLPFLNLNLQNLTFIYSIIF